MKIWIIQMYDEGQWLNLRALFSYELAEDYVNRYKKVVGDGLLLRIKCFSVERE